MNNRDRALEQSLLDVAQLQSEIADQPLKQGIAADFGPSLEKLLVDEGGYTNDAADPGGPTNFGITIHDYRMYVKPNGTATDVRAMSVDTAKKIYRSKYWDKQRCDELPAGVDYAVFDYGVNSGVGRSAKVLQRLLRTPVTAEINNEAIAAARKADPVMLVAAIYDERLAFLKGLRTWPVFGKGWGRRVAEGRVLAQKMVIDGKGKGGMKGPLAGGATGIGTAVAFFQNGYVITALIVGGLTLFGLVAYAIWRARKS